MWKKVENGQGSEIQYLPEVERWEDKPVAGLIICDDSGNKADLDLGLRPDSSSPPPGISAGVWKPQNWWSSWGGRADSGYRAWAPGMWVFQ